jgi:hypothetical protein
VQPKFPDGWFLLESIPSSGEHSFALGPFQADDFITEPDGSIAYVGQDRPIGLRVRSQEGDVLHANDGDMGPMDYRIVLVGPEAARYRE